MSIIAHMKALFRREDVKLELEDIQALILRSRPEPYVGLHAMLRIDDAAGGRELLTRMAPNITSAQNSGQKREGTESLGLKESHNERVATRVLF